MLTLVKVSWWVGVFYTIYSLWFFSICLDYFTIKNQNKTGGRKTAGRRSIKEQRMGSQTSLGLSGLKRSKIYEKVKPKGRAKQTLKVSRKWTKEISCWLTCEGMKARWYHRILSSPADTTHSIAPQGTGLAVRESRAALIPVRSPLLSLLPAARPLSVLGAGGVSFIYLSLSRCCLFYDSWNVNVEKDNVSAKTAFTCCRKSLPRQCQL